VVAGPLAFMEKTPLYAPLGLSGGTEVGFDETLERLVGLGYERVDRASRPGEFAVRGGIVDVFPSTRRSPVRVEWWGDEVESVRAVSLATQRVVRELEGVTVYAAREGDLAGLAAAAGDGYPEEASRGARVPGLDRLLLDLDPVSPAGLLPAGFEVWREGPQEGLPEDLEDLVREMYEEACPSPTSSSRSARRARRSRRRRRRPSPTRCGRRRGGSTRWSRAGSRSLWRALRAGRPGGPCTRSGRSTARAGGREGGRLPAARALRGPRPGR
jgi:hypothetical protein